MSYYTKSQRSEDNSIIWPGFVDVLASTLMVIIFVVLLFTGAQVYLGDLGVGKNGAVWVLFKPTKQSISSYNSYSFEL